MSWRVTPTGTRQHCPPPSAQPPLLIPTALPYRGTKESVFCSVVGSSSKREAMSLPCGTATSRYLIFSPVFLRLARLLPPCTVGKGSLSPARGSPVPTASGGRSRSCAGAEPRSARVQEQSTSGVDAPELRGPPCSKPHQQERKTPLNVQLSHLPSVPPWPGEPACTGTPLRGFGRVLSQVGHRDAALGAGRAMLCWHRGTNWAVAPSEGSVLGHFPAFRPWLRAGVLGAAAAAVLLTVGAALGSATSPL